PGVGKFLLHDTPPPTSTGGRGGHEWVAYRVNNLAIDKPHLLVVEYPDIDDMIVCLSIMHPFAGDVPPDKDGKRTVTLQNVLDYKKARNLGPQGNYLVTATPGFVAGNGWPLTGKRQSFSTVFYPGDDFAVIQFDNYSYINPKPMRLSRVIVYEIQDDIPKLDAPNLANDRIFGHYDEWLRDPTRNFAARSYVLGEMGSQGVAAPGHQNKFYRWNYVTAERLVKYLRFRGENTWFGGVVRYGSAMYPSETAHGGGPDMGPLFARMFEENGLTFVPSLAVLPTFPVRLLDRHTSYDVAQWADSSLQVNANGGFSYIIWGRGRAPNPLHPGVREAFAAQAAEIARIYKDYPAVKGVMDINSLNNGYLYPAYFGPSFIPTPPPGFDYEDASYRFTYDDRTTAEFEKRTGIKVPAVGPKRFAERKQWLLANHKEAWADFRCQVIAEAFEELAKPVKAESPRMEFFASESGGNAAVAYVGGPNTWTSRDMLRMMGSHLTAPRQPDYVPGYFFNEMNGGSVGHWGMVKKENLARFNALNTDPSTDGILDGNERVGACLGRSFFEYYSRPYPPARPWYTSKVHSCRYPVAGNRGGMLDFAVVLSRCAPLYICDYWVDGCIPQGHDEQFREFTAAYRTIPLGKYKTFFSEGYPGVTVRSATSQGKTYLYAVNTAAERRSVALEIRGELKERTAGYPALAGEGKAWPISLEPYAVRVFEVVGGELVAAGTK
ncbi:MAG: hypothetical protein PHR35_14065, partial [Kiritimatiellae bacterium]|nr:hypothetical protein [Kiritimatiellia bacterium]